MNDVFDNQILCKNCKMVMRPEQIERNGFILRTVKCSKCESVIVHPVDKQEYETFLNLKKKNFSVKMRMVGNSYAVSIPREIVDFMHEQEKMINDMVSLCFEDAGSLNLRFDAGDNSKSRTVSTREVKVVRNNNPVFHMRQIKDTAHPERNQTKVFKAQKLEGDKE